jgi:hypothetical protein
VPGRCKLYARVATPSGAHAKTHGARNAHELCELAADVDLPTTPADEELILAVFETALLGPDTMLGTARVGLWNAITERGDLLCVQLQPPQNSAAARKGARVGEVIVRLEFSLSDRQFEAQAEARQQWSSTAAADAWQPVPADVQRQWAAEAQAARASGSGGSRTPGASADGRGSGDGRRSGDGGGGYPVVAALNAADAGFVAAAAGVTLAVAAAPPTAAAAAGPAGP